MRGRPRRWSFATALAALGLVIEVGIGLATAPRAAAAIASHAPVSTTWRGLLIAAISTP